MSELVPRSVFDSAALRRQVERELGGVDAGHGHARLKVTLPDGRVEVLVAQRVGEHWKIDGAASFEVPTRTWGLSVAVELSW